MAWSIGAVLIVLPGVARLILHASWLICLICEVAALVANGWLRRDRLRRLQAIARWDGETPPN